MFLFFKKIHLESPQYTVILIRDIPIDLNNLLIHSNKDMSIAVRELSGTSVYV
jgi:hypothetical protein